METQAIIARPKEKKTNRCLSCGTTENMGRRKYCSAECRQKLRFKLNARVGLVQALNTRYATFYFSDELIVMDVLPYGTTEIFSFIYPRTVGRKPAEDFCQMANFLGNIWWDEKRRTNKRYLASVRVLDRARKDVVSLDEVKPAILKVYATHKNALTYLKIDRCHLWSSDLQTVIKAAYRQQAKNHHPDLGGDAAMFRKIHQAYQDLLAWSANPTVIRRRGFPDKWFYDGESNRWVQPLSP